MQDSTVYDADGRVLRHQVAISGSPFIADTMTFDPMGRILTQRGRTLTGGAMTTDNAYTGLGALAATAHSAGSTPTTEAFRVDGLGNAYWSEQWHLHLGGGLDEPAIRLRPYNIHGQLVAVTTADSGAASGESDDHYWYDNEGRTTYHSHWVNDTENTPIQEADYYDGGGHLVQLERHYGWFGNFDNANNPQQVIEQYRYDALGRRVLVFALRDSSCVTDGCESTVTRFVWMGQQLVAEIRGPASDATSDNVVESDSPGGNGEFGSPEAYGRVVYTQGPDLDRPFGLIRINGTWTVYAALFPHANWRDLEATATTESGTLYADRDLVRFAGANASAYLGMNLPADTAMYWMGSLITEQQDASGLLYRRNRYYDPASGKFTQPDPIGINGGLNTYGFANGDPINASDPMGLCPSCGGFPEPAGDLPLPMPPLPFALNSGGSNALATAIEGGLEALRDKIQIKFVTYTRTNSTGQIYVGRTSGLGDPQSIVNRRASGHPSRLAGFGPPVVDQVARGLEGYFAIRGREQQLIDASGGAQSDGGTSANVIRGVSKNNPLGSTFWAASNDFFGPLSPYTGNH